MSVSPDDEIEFRGYYPAMEAPSTDPDFWNVRYRAGRTPWDQGGVPPALTRYLSSHPGEEQRVLIPGCGSGYEMMAFARAGYRVTAIDFSAAAVARARSTLPPDLAAHVIQDDLFTHEFAEAPFDLVYERTFLCALPPEMWPRVVTRLAELLGDAGTVVGLYYFGDKADGPPFGLEPTEASRLFDARFLLVADQPVPAGESLPLFAGRERWQERQKRAEPPGDASLDLKSSIGDL